MKIHHQLAVVSQFILGGVIGHAQPEAAIIGVAKEQSIVKKQRSLLEQAPICLYQADFDHGTHIIYQPGNYKLCEDITFYPLVNPPEEVGAAAAFEPDFPGPFDENAFGLGFFAALSIATSDVKLDLNGYTIQQSAGHALMQRFFAVIELADSPFIPNAGPANFVGDGNEFKPASNVKIFGPGTIGLSSHHGIHGNNNDNIEIKDVTFQDFEVAAVSLNKVNKLTIEDCNISRNRHDVPVLGMFSAAKFIRPYGKILKDSGYKMYLRGVETSAADVYDALVNAMNVVYDDVLKFGKISRADHPMEYNLFHNPHQVVDGPCYAFLVHGKGPAVGDFGFDILDDDLTSGNIVIKNNKIRRIKCWTNEVPATIAEDNKVMTDPRGAVLQLIRSSDNAPIAINEDCTFKGNVVADMQIMVAKALQDKIITATPQLQTFPNTINSTIIEWAESATAEYEPKYRCNGDSMHHVNKGMTIIRVDDALGFKVINNTIARVFNLSPPPFGDCADYHEGSIVDHGSGLQQGANIRGISIAASTGQFGNQSVVAENTIRNFNSAKAVVLVGIDVQGMSDHMAIRKNSVDLRRGVGKDETDKYISLRLRGPPMLENDIKVKKNNDFVQEVQYDGSISTMSSLSRGIRNSRVEGCDFDKDDHVEWQYGATPGGCPFGFEKKRNIFVEGRK